MFWSYSFLSPNFSQILCPYTPHFIFSLEKKKKANIKSKKSTMHTQSETKWKGPVCADPPFLSGWPVLGCGWYPGSLHWRTLIFLFPAAISCEWFLDEG